MINDQDVQKWAFSQQTSWVTGQAGIPGSDASSFISG